MDEIAEITLVLILIFGILWLAHKTRECNPDALYEKLYSLMIGMIIGVIYYGLDLNSSLFINANLMKYALILNIIEIMHNLPKAYIYNYLENFLLFSYIGGISAFLLSSLIIQALIPYISASTLLIDAQLFTLCLLIPGTSLRSYQLSIPNYISIFFISWIYPLFFTLESGPLITLKHITLSSIFGVSCGIFAAFLFRFPKMPAKWTVLEVLETSLLSIIVSLTAEAIGVNGILAQILSLAVMIKYVFISNSSMEYRKNFVLSSSGFAEILVQLWLGVNIIKADVHVNNFALLSVLVISCACYLMCIGFQRLLKIKGTQVKDCVLILVGFRGSATLYLASFLHKELRDLVLIVCVIVNCISLVIYYFLRNNRNIATSLISSNLCSKLKEALQAIEEVHIIPCFTKTLAETSIMSPKFNENSIRVEAGIQMQPEPRDETSRELQALNLNMTESDVSGVLHLK